jgi:CRP-like cAMP-binding protein
LFFCFCHIASFRSCARHGQDRVRRNQGANPEREAWRRSGPSLFYRARAAQLVRGNRCRLPISLAQLGETLGMAIATVNRTLADLRRSGTVDLRDSELIVLKWRELQRLGDFSPIYLHLKRQSPPA